MDRETDGLTDRKNPSREQIERTSREKQRVDGSAARTCLLERALFSSFTCSLSTIRAVHSSRFKSDVRVNQKTTEQSVFSCRARARQ